MLHENLKILRKEKGISQEELASRLHVVRQTVSKWEKGLSVPDAELLVQLAEILETSVSVLLGETVEKSTTDMGEVAQQLERLNASLAEKNDRSRRTWKTVRIVFISMVLILSLLFCVIPGVFASLYSYRVEKSEPYIVEFDTEEGGCQ